ncbi:MAG: hypothetical protein ACE5IR_01655 [bacterium]
MSELGIAPIAKPLKGVEKSLYTNEQREKGEKKSKKKKKEEKGADPQPIIDKVVLSEENEIKNVKPMKKPQSSQVGKGDKIDIRV